MKLLRTSWAPLALALAACVPVQYERPAPWSMVGETTVAGFVFPESAGCDREENVIYVSQFGGTGPCASWTSATCFSIPSPTPNVGIGPSPIRQPNTFA